MIFDVGPFVFVLPVPRFHAGWFAGAFVAVLGFGVMVMLLVASSCGERVSTEPGPADPAQTQVASQCYPFCLGTKDTTTHASAPMSPYEQ